MKEGTNRIGWPLAMGALCALIFLAVPHGARAATMFIAPNTGSFRPDQTFNVTVRVNTAGQAVNAAEGVLKFDPARLRVVSVSGDSTIFNLNVQQPDFNNTAGTVTFAGVVLNPGYTGASGNLLNVTFRAVAAGQTTVSFQSGAVLANDGQGTNVLTAMSAATYTVIGGPTPAPTPITTTTPAPATTGSLAPIITSPTHPDDDTWYARSDVTLEWPLPDGLEGVSWLIDARPDGNPGNILDGLVSTVSFDDQEDGETYFHLKFRRGGVFGPIAHYRLRIDTVPPVPFSVTRTRFDDPTDPQPWLLYQTTDATSGIHQYRMRIGDGAWFDVPESTPERPYRLPVQAPGTHDVIIEAIDAAGLATRATYRLVIEAIGMPRITMYPEGVPADAAFGVSGTAPSESTVTVRAFRMRGARTDEEAAASVPARASLAGHWDALMSGLAPGWYELEAVATDARGAVSFPSERVILKVGSWYHNAWFSAWYWFTGLPLWLRWLLPLIVLSLLLWFQWWRRRRPVVVVHDRNDDPRVVALIEDIERELDTLNRLGKSRPLYPEERHLSRKLETYRKELKKMLRSGTAKRPRKIAVKGTRSGK